MSQRDAVERRAYQLYEARGREDGHDWDDWLQAEREVNSLSTASAVHTANDSSAVRRRRADRNRPTLAHRP